MKYKGVDVKKYLDAAEHSVFRDLLGINKSEEEVDVKIKEIRKSTGKRLRDDRERKLQNLKGPDRQKAEREVLKKSFKSFRKEFQKDLNTQFVSKKRNLTFFEIKVLSAVSRTFYFFLLPFMVKEFKDQKPEGISLEDYIINDLRGKYEFE
jgi:hypothetical protein